MSVRTALLDAGVGARVAAREAPLAERAMRDADITTQARAAMFLAQVLHESGGLRWFEELASGAAYEGRADLGNVQPGDGRRFKGRGPIQLTGRANYRAAGKALKLPLEHHPELAAQHAVGWRIAAWYWQTRGLNMLADDGKFREITRRINGGYNGYDDRRRYLARIRDQDCRPAGLWHLTTPERERVREYDRLKAEGRDLPRRRELRDEMTEQRKRIWRNAQPRSRGGDGRGWGYAAREQRYRSLRARTR